MKLCAVSTAIGRRLFVYNQHDPRSIGRACEAVKAEGFSFNILDEHVETASGGTSHIKC
jgi:hypothetical protein